MNSSMSIEINGLLVSLSVQADSASLRQLFSDSEHGFSSEELSCLFSRCLEEMPAVLLQAHDAICRNLLSSYLDSVPEEVVKRSVTDIYLGTPPRSKQHDQI